MGNPVVHFEIGGPDDQALVRFYADLFGWRMQPVPGGTYTLVDTAAGGGINGGIGKSGTGEPWATFYVEVPDLQPVLDRAESMGAKTVVPVTSFGDMVTFAMFADTDGLLVGLVQGASEPADQSQMGPSAGDGVAVDWFEVLGSDAQRTQAFYAELFGWSVDTTEAATYAMVDTAAGGGIPGGLGSGADARWATVYAAVPDIERALARAAELGGSRVYGPLDIDDHMRTGAIRDPAGNVFGVYHHQPH